MTVALKSGSEGKAFSVITDELKRLSGRTIGLTESVTDLGRSMLEIFSRLRSFLSELNALQSGLFASLEESLAAGFAGVETDALAAGRFFGELMARARGVKAPVLRVMNEVQLQDIVRQSLQHVGISLAEARAATSTAGGDKAFVAAVAELCGSLVDDIVAKLDASAASFGSDMESVRGLVDECERERSAYLQGQGGESSELDIDSYNADSARYLGGKRNALAIAKRMSEQVHGLDESFKGLSKLLSRFQTIVVASRIEVAKTQALAGVANTVAEMIELTEKIETDVGEAMATTKDFIQLASAAIAEYSASAGQEDQRLVEALRGVEENIRGLEGVRSAVDRAIEAFSVYTPDFIALIGEAGEAL
ncbi:MAG: hypothetical protein Q8M76_01175, partial [Spirochaetaceae bacterium]|nr:hypothetical protein [Spirochaetaceae bacterium]